MLFFVTGSSGSGKSAIIPYMNDLPDDIKVYDFDDVGVPDNAGTAWRQHTTERWIQTAISHQDERRDTIICGGAVPGEILACPSAPEVKGIAICLLDCTDVMRVKRLRGRHSDAAIQEKLNWATWLRIHATDPTWYPPVIQTGEVPEMQWSRWSDWAADDPRWRVWTLDTTMLTPRITAEHVMTWMRDEKQRYRMKKKQQQL